MLAEASPTHEALGKHLMQHIHMRIHRNAALQVRPGPAFALVLVSRSVVQLDNETGALHNKAT